MLFRRSTYIIKEYNRLRFVQRKEFSLVNCLNGAMLGKHRIVMVRHGESEWNEKNLFSGWYDTNLSSKGVKEAQQAGLALASSSFQFDVAHTSVLTRAKRTLDIILQGIDQKDLPTYETWRLNERHYGGLTGLNKAETAAKYGDAQVQIWRRSFDTPPPPMDENHQYYNSIVGDPRYSKEPSKDEFPMFESLKMTIERTLPYWYNNIVPDLKNNKTVLVVAHGNSLRGIIKHLDCISDKDIMELNLPTGIPFEYQLDKDMKPVVSLRFLGDEETVKKAMEAVANQGKAKK
ncbi:phosphoglycerate mutase 2 isoform X1 [Cimex lectularius]|uniref:Phosphoglycerate mutase n=2 Tax=Cimex lectularius TaxID=79782 RepID=A0A8I6TL87_CIMLE|nr:phosphoglycerate mutase 2 isoform X1 [Cimex lectularius]